MVRLKEKYYRYKVAQGLCSLLLQVLDGKVDPKNVFQISIERLKNVQKFYTSKKGLDDISVKIVTGGKGGPYYGVAELVGGIDYQFSLKGKDTKKLKARFYDFLQLVIDGKIYDDPTSFKGDLYGDLIHVLDNMNQNMRRNK